MQEKYPGCSFKYDFSEILKVYRIAMYPKSFTTTDEEFNKDVLSFMDEMEKEYHDDMPIFSDEDEMFKITNPLGLIEPVRPQTVKLNDFSSCYDESEYEYDLAA